jgi:hypothetical protein
VGKRQKSEMRFRGINLIVARLLDGTLPMEEKAGLPKGTSRLAWQASGGKKRGDGVSRFQLP